MLKLEQFPETGTLGRRTYYAIHELLGACLLINDDLICVSEFGLTLVLILQIIC